MNLDKIFDDINNKIKNEFLEYIINDFINSINLILSTLNTVKEPINYKSTIEFFKKNFIPEIDNNYYNNTKTELFNFIKKNYNNIFDDNQLNILTDNFLKVYYPLIKKEFINYINSL